MTKKIQQLVVVGMWQNHTTYFFLNFDCANTIPYCLWYVAIKYPIVVSSWPAPIPCPIVTSSWAVTIPYLRVGSSWDWKVQNHYVGNCSSVKIPYPIVVISLTVTIWGGRVEFGITITYTWHYSVSKNTIPPFNLQYAKVLLGPIVLNYNSVISDTLPPS